MDTSSLDRNWVLDEDNKLRRFYEFTDFVTAMDFVNRVAYVSEEINHHPDIEINYNRIGLTLWTHSAHKVTDKDIHLAKRIDLLAS